VPRQAQGERDPCADRIRCRTERQHRQSQRFERVSPEKLERLGQLARSEAVEPVGTVFVLDKPFANLYWKIKTLHRADPMLRHPSDFTLFDVLLRESRI